MAIVVRRAAVKDADVIHALWSGLNQYEAKLDPLLKKDTAFYRRSKNEYTAALRKKNEFFLIAEENNVPLGYIYGWIEKAPYWIMPERRGFVCDVFVVPGKRGSGVGKKLMDDLSAVFASRGVTWMTLDVYPNNVTTRKIWKKLGFKEYIIEMARTLEPTNQ